VTRLLEPVLHFGKYAAVTVRLRFMLSDERPKVLGIRPIENFDGSLYFLMAF